jgi:acyl-coenzyme A synthetase/AMP-(fatty) acid ligase
MTEALPVTDIALHQIDAAEADAVGLTVLGAGNGVCVGPPLPGVTVAVSPLSSLGSADGPPTQTSGVTGEICVRANHVKDRYDALWATEHESSRNPGWHRTGDVGHLDDAGRLWVEGRLAHVIATPGGVVTPVGVEQRVEAVSGVSAAAVVGVGPVGAQVVVVVVVPADSGPTATAGSSPVAEPGLADAVRSAAGSAAGAAGVDVAAVLVAADLPRDIRHASKVDRREVARWATEVLAGGPRRLPSR